MADLPATQLLPVPDRGRRHTRERTIRLGDVDVQGELRLDSLARYMQDVATDDALDAGIDNAMGWLVRRTMIRVARPARLNERVTLTTYCTGYGRSWAERRTSIRSGGDADNVQIEAVSLWVQIDPDSGRPARLDDGFHAIYGEAAAGRTVSSRLSLSKPSDGVPAETWRFRATDLDPFGHVNNAAQWVVMEELLARRAAPRAGVGEIEFLAPADLEAELRTDGPCAWLHDGTGVTTALRWTPA